MATKQRIIELLREKRPGDLIEIARCGGGILRTLISLTYDKASLVCWRAIEAVGLIAGDIASRDPASARSLVQKLLWMMRDESGNNPWSSPEMLGEIVRNSPEEFSDIAPIIASFHDEEILRRGVMRAMVRISEVRPALVADSGKWLAERYLDDGDPSVRAYALRLAARLGLKEYIPEVEGLRKDENGIMMYEGGEFVEVTVGKIAEEAVILLRD